MSKTITITLKKSLIKEAVKTDTFITGKSELLNDGSNNAKVYNEQVGDDTFHERKLDRTFRGALGSFKSNLVDFVDPTVGTISDATSGDNVTITMVVSDRFNSSLANTLAELSQDYIINKMITMWWLAIKSELAAQYQSIANESWLSVHRCLTKMAPATSTSDYDSVQGSVTTA